MSDLWNRILTYITKEDMLLVFRHLDELALAARFGSRCIVIQVGTDMFAL